MTCLYMGNPIQFIFLHRVYIGKKQIKNIMPQEGTVTSEYKWETIASLPVENQILKISNYSSYWVFIQTLK